MLQNRQIEAFRAVMLTGAMTAAAEMIHVTQPAVSRLIRDLEAELGFMLFQRRGNVLAPTAQARALLQEVERSFVGLQRIAEFAKSIQTGQGGSLRVAALPAMAGFLPRFVARFSRQRPGLTIGIDSLPSPVVRELVASGKVDIGVTAVPFETSGLVTTMLEDIAVVIMPDHHPLARQSCVEPKDLLGQDIVLLEKFSPELRHPVGRALHGVPYGSVLKTPLSSIACVLVSEGMGLAIVDPFSASEFTSTGLTMRPLKPAMVIGTAVVRSSEQSLSPIAQDFHDAFVHHAQAFLRDVSQGLRPALAEPAATMD